MAMSACRVCLSSDRKMYCLANTALEETYERITSGTLIMERRPCCVCGVCLSALRRCRRFIETARQANDALDWWIENHFDTDKFQLKENPLFTFKQSRTEFYEIIDQAGVKEEIDMAENEVINEEPNSDEDNIEINEIKSEPNNIVEQNTNSDNIDNVNTQSSSNSEYFNLYDDMIDIENNTQITDDVKYNLSEMLDNRGENNGVETDENIQVTSEVTEENIQRTSEVTEENIQGTSEVTGENIQGTSEVTEENIQVTMMKLRPRKRAKPNEDTDSLKHVERSPKTAEHHLKKTNNTTAINDKYFSKQYNNKTENKYNLDAPLKLQSDLKLFACDKCKYKCKHKGNLKRHLMIHSDIKPFACDKCDYKCKYKGNLNQHVMIHSGIKPYVCDKCNYKCKQKLDLSRHIMTHSEMKPFACDKCNYKCKYKRNLKQHLMIHSGIKPFACDKCDYKCTRKGHLKRHLILLHSGIKSFACDECDFKCKQKRSLKRHLMIHSGIVVHSRYIR